MIQLNKKKNDRINYCQVLVEAVMAENMYDSKISILWKLRNYSEPFSTKGDEYLYWCNENFSSIACA